MIVKTKTRGHGLIQAWPLYTPEGDIVYGLEERGYIELAMGAFWRVRTEHGAVCLVPTGLAVVTWEKKAQQQPTLAETVVDAVKRGVESAAVSEIFPLGEAVKAPGYVDPTHNPLPYECKHCHQRYARRVDAAVCEHRCDPNAVPYVGGSCDGCGYPMSLHMIGSNTGSFLVNVDGHCAMITGEKIPYSKEDAALTRKGRAACVEARRCKADYKAKLATPVDDLQLSVRSMNCMQQENIETLGDLIKKTADELLKVKNFGQKSLKEIREVLGDHGLSLKGEEVPF